MMELQLLCVMIDMLSDSNSILTIETLMTSIFGIIIKECIYKSNNFVFVLLVSG